MSNNTFTNTKGKDYDFVFKIVLVGDTCVGKSCLLVRFADDLFNDSYVTTIGVDFRFKTLIVKDKVTKIQIWDTAGQERYRSITTAYYRGASAIFICFDLTNKESFDNIPHWIEELSAFTDNDISKLILANKADLVDKRQVTLKDIEEFEKKTGLKVIEVSAKTGNKVEDAFRNIVETLIEKKDKHHNNPLLITDGRIGKGGCCK